MENFKSKVQKKESTIKRQIIEEIFNHSNYGYTSRILREEFSELSKMPGLWTRSYFVSTAGNVSSETIKKYVENQKKRY